MKHTKADLLQMQSLPLSDKIRMTERRIRDWHDYWDGEVYVSFSGGKDSTVLLDLVRNLYPDVEAVFVDTGLEYPEIREFVKTFDNVTIMRPKTRFDEVIKTYGYPVISKETSNTIYYIKKNGGSNGWIDGRIKRGYVSEKYKAIADLDFFISDKCCSVMKKQPAKHFAKQSGKKPFLGQLAEESNLRMQLWMKNGCNGFDMKMPVSNPISFWTEQDILQYLKDHDLKIASVYGSIEYAIYPEQIRWSEVDPELEIFETKKVKQLTTTGCNRTGCIFCGFGCHLEKEPTRFQRLKETHPRQYRYCIEGGEYNEAGIWQPNKNGLGMSHVFDELNKIYGEDFIKY
jgi:3'-phosphoadenosine 5'-phosphosulfate sulfotransferase (PAPS reductase)/FAD synthetase